MNWSGDALVKTAFVYDTDWALNIFVSMPHHNDCYEGKKKSEKYTN